MKGQESDVVCGIPLDWSREVPNAPDRFDFSGLRVAIFITVTLYRQSYCLDSRVSSLNMALSQPLNREVFVSGSTLRAQFAALNPKTGFIQAYFHAKRGSSNLPQSSAASARKSAMMSGRSG